MSTAAGTTPSNPIYLDHASSAPLRPEALAAMLPHLAGPPGNPSGSHVLARRARAAVEDARDVVAEHVGCRPGEVVFTSGGTESCNLALLGTTGLTGGSIVCSAAEHEAVLSCCRDLGGVVVPVDATGAVDLDALGDALVGAHAADFAVVSAMLANNEVGTIQDLAPVAEVVARAAPRAVLHTDAVAAGSWLDLAAEAAPAQLVSLASHKIGGPKGVGVLVVRGGASVAPLLHGGPQERERRPGTPDVAGIAGMAAALQAGSAARAREVRATTARRERLATLLQGALGGVHETAAAARRRLPGICHLRFDGVEQEDLLLLLDEAGVCASAGASCSSGALEPSHVLVALGLSDREARSALRLSLGWDTTDEDVERAAEMIVKAVGQLRR